MAQTRILPLILLSLALTPILPAAAKADDDYLRGYVAAVVERQFGLKGDAVAVRRGVVTIHADLSQTDEERLKTGLLDVEGIREVNVIPADTRLPGLIWFPGRGLF